MAQFAGLLTFILLWIVAAYILPIPFSLKLASFAVIVLANGIVWHQNPDTQMPVLKALGTTVIGAVVLAALATVDVGVGYLAGYRTVADAFLHSGPVGGVADICLATLAVFVGIPTLIRAVVMYYERRGG